MVCSAMGDPSRLANTLGTRNSSDDELAPVVLAAGQRAELFRHGASVCLCGRLPDRPGAGAGCGVRSASAVASEPYRPRWRQRDALRTYGPSQRAARILANPEMVQRSLKVVSGRPTQLALCPLVDVDALNVREQAPAMLLVDGLAFREQPPHDRSGVGA
jgi:hypothetical protein